MRIGFIGVGIMGHGMAENLIRAGYTLAVLANRKCFWRFCINRLSSGSLPTTGVNDAGRVTSR